MRASKSYNAGEGQEKSRRRKGAGPVAQIGANDDKYKSQDRRRIGEGKASAR